MANHITLGFQLSRPLGGERKLTAVPLIDGLSLYEAFRGHGVPHENTLQLPYEFRDRGESFDFSSLDSARSSIGADFISWSGYSALTLNSSDYPSHAIPLLTCCGDELCGYFACSMTRDDGMVVWHNFGWVHDDGVAPDDATAKELFEFSPITRQLEFTFEPEQYQAFLEALIRATWDDGPSGPNRRKAARYRPRILAKARGLAFPSEVRFRLAEALAQTDPLDLRRYGTVDPDVYAGFSHSYWGTQYEAFGREPVSSLVRALEGTFNRDASRAAVAETVFSLTVE